MLKRFFFESFVRIQEINKKYAVRNVEMSKAVSISLLFLRVYLVFLVCLLVYKFITLL